MNDDLEHRKRLARGVFATLDGVPVPALRLLGRALEIAGRVGADKTLTSLGTTLDFFADSVEYDDVSGGIATLRMARDLARVPDEFLEALADVDVQPWRSFRDAALEVRAHRLATAAS